MKSLSEIRTPLSHSSFWVDRSDLSFSVPINYSSTHLPNQRFPSSPILSPPFSHSYTRQRNEDGHGDGFVYDGGSTRAPKLFVVQPRIRPDTVLQGKLSEALNLANSLEERDGYSDKEFSEKQSTPHVVVQNPVARFSKSRAATYFGRGTVETVKCQLDAVESQKGELDAVFVNTNLSGIQQRNLERAWGKPVLDRVGLIIEIFNAHAQTKEAKLQSELAALMYKRSRLVRVRGPDGRSTFGAAGEAEVVSARGRGSGGRGFISGAGETELQLQRRRISERKKHLLYQIEEVRRTRAVQRAARKRRGCLDGEGLPTIAVVGYTNAGKSTLVNALSDAYLYSDDRLFATVDPSLRSVILPSGRKVLLSDTVGFISDLPVELIEAFHATLEEVVEADLLVHVLDSSASNLEDHRSTVLQVLQQIGVSKEKLQNMIEVWNKVDLQDDEKGASVHLDDSDFGGDDVASEEPDTNSSDDDDDVSVAGSGDDEMESQLSSADAEDETINEVQLDDYFDGCMSPGYNPEGSSIGVDAVIIEKHHSETFDLDSNSQNLHVKTSALTGVGLQELLELIDAKLSAQRVVERSSFDRKWRPPCTQEDSGVAVER